MASTDTAPVMGIITQFARDLEAKQRKRRLEKSSKLWRPTASPATDLGHKCTRRVVLHQVKPEDAAAIGEELAGIFAEGKMHEKDVRIELAKLGHEVVGAEENYRDEKLMISGTIDGKLEVPITSDQMLEDARTLGCEVRFGVIRVPVEIKSTMATPPRTGISTTPRPPPSPTFSTVSRRWCPLAGPSRTTAMTSSTQALRPDL